MSVSLPTIFIIYLEVFLAVIFGAWFSYMWLRRKWAGPVQRNWICGVCGRTIQKSKAAFSVRCSACGALQETIQLKEK